MPALSTAQAPAVDTGHPDRFESGEILAICRLENGRLVIEEVAYFRMTAGDDGLMLSAAPVGAGDLPGTIAVGEDVRPFDVVRRCATSPSRFLRRLFGTPAPRTPPPAESPGDLAVRAREGLRLLQLPASLN